LFFRLFENWLLVTDLNSSYRSKYQNFEKICPLGAKLLVKIKLQLANAVVSFVYTSHSQEYIEYLSVVQAKWNSLNERKEIERKQQWI
jgi:hypothetical protein